MRYLCLGVHRSVGASLLAIVVNDDACGLVKRGVVESIASRLAPTGIALHRSVGASLLARVVNDDACGLVKRGVFESIASRLAPTGIALPVPGFCRIA